MQAHDNFLVDLPFTLRQAQGERGRGRKQSILSVHAELVGA
jgi:hypothetical protein